MIVYISSTCDCKTRTSIPDLNVGISPEVLSCHSSFSTDVNGTMRQNYKEIFSGSVKIHVGAVH